MATLLSSIDFSSNIAFQSSIKPQITSISPYNSIGYNISTGKSTINANSIAYITIAGSNFTTNTQVFTKIIGVTAKAILASSITFVSSKQLNVQLSPTTAGNALLYVVSSYGTLGITPITFA
jgi:hypothetical protein